MERGPWIPALALCWLCLALSGSADGTMFGMAGKMADAAAEDIATPVFDLAGMSDAAVALPWMEHLPDRGREQTWQSALADPGWAPLARANLGYLGHPVWTRLQVTNTGPENRLVVIFNQRPMMSHISVVILDGDRSVRNLELGFLDTRTPYRSIANRVGHFWLDLPPGETRTIITRLESIGVTQAGWKVAEADRFARDSLTSFAVLGLYAGITLALIAHGLVAWLFYRRREYGLMVGYAVLFLLFLATITGLARVLDFNLPPAFWSLGGYLFPILAQIFWLSFADYLLGARRTMPRAHRVLRGLQAAFAGLAGLFVLASWYPVIYSWGMAVLAVTLVLYATILALGILAVRLRLELAWVFLAGHAPIFVVSGLVFILLQAGILGDIDAILHLQPLLMILQVGIMAGSLGLLHRKSQRARIEQQRQAVEQSRFASVGRTIGMVVHQWRTPLARLGTQIAELRASFRSEDRLRRRTELIRDELLPSMEDGVRELIATMNDFRDFFSSNRPRETFAPERVLNQVLDMLGPRLTGVRLERHLVRDTVADDPILLHGHPSALAHVLMVLLGNALDTLHHRQTPEPLLTVTLHRDPATSETLISVEDNAGGIRLRPLEQIFETFVSEKGDQHMGMGLGIARKLVEERMGGSIQVENTAHGARFTIRLP